MKNSRNKKLSGYSTDIEDVLPGSTNTVGKNVSKIKRSVFKMSVALFLFLQ